MDHTSTNIGLMGKNFENYLSFLTGYVTKGKQSYGNE